MTGNPAPIPKRRALALGHLEGFSIASNEKVASVINVSFPRVQNVQIKSLKVFHIPGYQDQLPINGDGCDLGVGSRRSLSFTIAVAHQLTPDPGCGMVESKDPVLELLAKVIFNPLDEAFSSRLFLDLECSANKLADRL